MPIQIQIEDKTKALEHLAAQLSDKKINVANVRAINKAIGKANTQYRREVVKNYNVAYGDTKEMISPKRATYGTPQGTISGRVTPLSLSRFNPSFVKDGQVFSIKSVKNKQSGKRGLVQKQKKATKKDKAGGVSFEIQKGHRKTLPFAFMLQSDKTGADKQIWARGVYSGGKFSLSKKRMPISPLKTTAPFGMMTKDKISEEVKKGASDDMVKEFERQVELLLRQAGAK